MALSAPTTNATNAAVAIDPAATSVTTTIIDSATQTFALTQASTTVPEGSADIYTVHLSNPIDPGVTVSVNIAIALPGGLGGAEAADFTHAFLADIDTAINATPGVTRSGNTLTFDSTFNTSAGFSFTLPTLNDTQVEGNESYSVALSAPTTTATGAAVVIAPAATSVTATILDNDTATWSITQASSTVTEGSADSYTVHLAGTLQAGENASIVLSLTNVTTDTNGSDLATEAQFDAAVQAVVTAYNAGSDPGSLSYDAATNKLTFTSDGTGAMGNLVISLTAVDDTLMEGDESYTVALATPTSATGSSIALGANSVTTTILANDIDVAPVVDLNGSGISGNNNTVSYPSGESQLPIAPLATITDPDSRTSCR